MCLFSFISKSVWPGRYMWSLHLGEAIAQWSVSTYLFHLVQVLGPTRALRWSARWAGPSNTCTTWRCHGSTWSAWPTESGTRETPRRPTSRLSPPRSTARTSLPKVAGTSCRGTSWNASTRSIQTSSDLRPLKEWVGSLTKYLFRCRFRRFENDLPTYVVKCMDYGHEYGLFR